MTNKNQYFRLCFSITFFFFAAFCLAVQAVADSPELVSKSSNDEQADSGATRPHISGNGRYVAFVSVASNLTDDVAVGTLQVYRHDRKSRETILISKNAEGEPGDAASQNVFISHTGRYVGFGSEATNLDSEDDNGLDDCFLVDIVLDTIERYSSSKNGVATSSCDWFLTLVPQYQSVRMVAMLPISQAMESSSLIAGRGL